MYPGERCGVGQRVSWSNWKAPKQAATSGDPLRDWITKPKSGLSQRPNVRRPSSGMRKPAPRLPEYCPQPLRQPQPAPCPAAPSRSPPSRSPPSTSGMILLSAAKRAMPNTYGRPLGMRPQGARPQAGVCPASSSLRPPAPRPQAGVCPASSSLRPPAPRPQAGVCPASSSLRPPAPRPQAGVCPASSSLRPPAPRPQPAVCPAASALRPPGASGLRPPGASGLCPPGASGLRPPGASGLRPPGASGLRPPGASGLRPPGASGLRPPGTSGLQSFSSRPLASSTLTSAIIAPIASANPQQRLPGAYGLQPPRQQSPDASLRYSQQPSANLPPAPNVSTTVVQHQTTTQRFLQPPSQGTQQRGLIPPAPCPGRSLRPPGGGSRLQPPGVRFTQPPAIAAPPAIVAIPVEMVNTSYPSPPRARTPSPSPPPSRTRRLSTCAEEEEEEDEPTVSIPVASVSGFQTRYREIIVPASIAMSPEETIVSVSPETGIARLLDLSFEECDDAGALVPQYGQPNLPSRAIQSFISQLDEADRVERRELGAAVENIQRNRRNMLFMGMEYDRPQGTALSHGQYTEEKSRSMWDARVRDEELRNQMRRRQCPARQPQDYLQGDMLTEGEDEMLNDVNISLVDSDEEVDEDDFYYLSGSSASEDEDYYNIASQKMPRGMQSYAMDQDIQELQNMYDPLDFLNAPVEEIQTTTSRVMRTTTCPANEMINFDRAETCGEELFRLVKAYDLNI